MIERACEIVEMPGGGLAALMPLADVSEKHWVAVSERSNVMHARGHIHRETMSWRVAARPWTENWKPMGMREVVVVQPDEDYDLGGGD
ncbi:MAG TPA: hypothetical protein VFE47_23945 [Tepidisphaeraceae bacterium]|jgi:hypothetical protein|nr:hypothetical protein [Tepidisphaeraceae bacterium]